MIDKEEACQKYMEIWKRHTTDDGLRIHMSEEDTKNYFMYGDIFQFGRPLLRDKYGNLLDDKPE